LRATLLARLNTFLLGYPAVHPDIVKMYAEFLNRQIHPVVETRGSVGQADISILPRLGLAMLGEGQVIFKGKRMSAKQALQQAESLNASGGS